MLPFAIPLLWEQRGKSVFVGDGLCAVPISIRCRVFYLMAIDRDWRPLSRSVPVPLRGTPRVGTAVFVPYNTRGSRDGTGAAPYGVTCMARFLFHNGNSPTHAALQIPHPPPQYISVLFPRKIELFVLSKMPLFAIMIYY